MRLEIVHRPLKARLVLLRRMTPFTTRTKFKDELADFQCHAPMDDGQKQHQLQTRLKHAMLTIERAMSNVSRLSTGRVLSMYPTDRSSFLHHCFEVEVVCQAHMRKLSSPSLPSIPVLSIVRLLVQIVPPTLKISYLQHIISAQLSDFPAPKAPITKIRAVEFAK